ncbi:hypothetical protein GCM10025734_17350 [Kitasatospora paranensis]
MSTRVGIVRRRAFVDGGPAEHGDAPAGAVRRADLARLEGHERPGHGPDQLGSCGCAQQHAAVAAEAEAGRQDGRQGTDRVDDPADAGRAQEPPAVPFVQRLVLGGWVLVWLHGIKGRLEPVRV